MGCDTKDFMFPMQADIYYPIIDQSPYGNISKIWTYDRTVPCNIIYAGVKEKEEVRVNIDMTQDTIMSARFRKDIRSSSFGEMHALSNIVITNVKDKNCNEIYVEPAGPRYGQSTLFEIATFQPFINPFGVVEHYKLILRKSENQEFDV